MRTTLIGFATGAFLLFFSTLAYAEPPQGVGAAITVSGFDCFYSVVVGPFEDGDTFTPFLPGGFGQMIISTAENTKGVFSNSANGNQNLSCHGRIEFGSEVMGIDAISLEPASGSIAEDLGTACDALEMDFPGICRGNGAAVLNGNQLGQPCEISPGFFTLDWRQIVTRSGRVTLSCHFTE